MGGSYVSVEVSSPVDLTLYNKPFFTQNKTIHVRYVKLFTCCGICGLLSQNKITRRLLNVVAMEFYPRIILCRFLYVVYVVWQKSNETDFTLTMNFVLFTNRGYPLQNSSLGQLHSDGGVSIVRSSAGRLLLVYLSPRRLRSSGYYPKYQNGVLSSGF